MVKKNVPKVVPDIQNVPSKSSKNGEISEKTIKNVPRVPERWYIQNPYIMGSNTSLYRIYMFLYMYVFLSHSVGGW